MSSVVNAKHEYGKYYAEELEPHILDKFEILEKIGAGAYAHVWKVKDKKSSEIVVLKKNYKAFSNVTDAQRTFREVMLLRELHG